MIKKQVASISGGRTSHFMAYQLISEYGRDNVDLVYCDTGAEHDGTYDFIRKFEKDIGLKITVLRLVMPKESGVGGKYVITDTNNIGKDYKPFQGLMEKYGRPFNPSGKFCIEKTVNQLSYLCHTQPELAREWAAQVSNPNIPSKDRKESEYAMYRDGSRKISFIELHDEAMVKPQSYWESKITMEKRLSPCAEGSCELFNDEVY